MNLVRFDPFRELEVMSSRLNRLFGESSGRLIPDAGGFGDFAPAVDIEETDKAYVVKADLPEVKKEDIKVGFEDGVLHIEGERKQEKTEQGKKFHRIERVYGKFVRHLTMPSEVDAAQISAAFNDGVLHVTLPKSVSVKPKSIDVKIA